MSEILNSTGGGKSDCKGSPGSIGYKLHCGTRLGTKF